MSSRSSKVAARPLAVAAAIAALFGAHHVAQAALPRYPQAYDGKVVFIANNHLWSVPRAGGKAIQLTSGSGRDLYPRVSPDCRWIAYTRIGPLGTDVWVISAAGGAARRLTFHGGEGKDNIVVTWTPDSKSVVYLTKHNEWNQVVNAMYQVAVDGGLPRAMPIDDSVGLATFSPDGRSIAYNRILAQYGNWKRYNGGMARQVYTYNLTSRKLDQVTHWSGTNASPMWYGRRIYYLSDQGNDRRANIWVYDQDLKQSRQVTHLTKYDIDTPALGDNAITFQHAGKLYILSLPDERLRQVAVDMPTTNPRFEKHVAAVRNLIRDVEVVHDSDEPDQVDYALAPDGRHTLFSARGHIFSVPSGPGADRDLTGTSGGQEDHPAWSPDGRLVAYTTDADGGQQVAVRPAEGGKERVLTRFKTGYFFKPVFSPDGHRLSFSDGEHRLWLVGVDGSDLRQVAQDIQQGIHDQAFSPDGRWLAFSMVATARRRDLYLYEMATGQTTRLGHGENNDSTPTWSPDGRYLLFLSNRHENLAPSDQEVVLCAT